jgi:hypothetical protein
MSNLSTLLEQWKQLSTEYRDLLRLRAKVAQLSGDRTMMEDVDQKLAQTSGWHASFADHPPIVLPDGRKLKTLADCRDYAGALSARGRKAARWQYATAALLVAAEHGGPLVTVARMAVTRALRGTVDPEPPLPAKANKQARAKARRKKRRPRNSR